ncbi:hypothetical protein [Vibrio aestuarianus]|uniref:hypothetical protein n=1 Tax=Vibrio aestuarianus TaxID=28171 RepID=UPI00237D0DC2|nr:hypothetical protein [Vibrio aestuarianus]MDE1335815.1 hypothetical protein [Vibrio aestuarianus]
MFKILTPSNRIGDQKHSEKYKKECQLSNRVKTIKNVDPSPSNTDLHRPHTYPSLFNAFFSRPPSSQNPLTNRIIYDRMEKILSINKLRLELSVYFPSIAITDKPILNSAGLTQYNYDNNRDAVRTRRCEVAKSYNLNLSEAPFYPQFHSALAERIQNDRDDNNKIYGQCAEMASLAASILKKCHQHFSGNIYIIQLPNANHTITLISESNYSERQPIIWENEYSQGAIIVDLWQGKLSPKDSSQLVSFADENFYTKDKIKAIVQTKII